MGERAGEGTFPTGAPAAYRPRMQFRVLGPLEVADATGPIPLGGPKQRAVLAHLLIRRGRPVQAETLIDELWGDDPPHSARNTLQTYVSHLRKALGADRIEGRARTYLLDVPEQDLDSARFERLLHEARAADGQVARQGSILREALSLWRGPAYADLGSEEALAAEVARLDELRLTALEDRISADLATNRHAELIGELEALTRRRPLRERLWAHLVLALYRSGRQADALAAFQRARGVLADELGVDPSPALRRLQERILRQDPSLEVPAETLRGYELLEPIGKGTIAVVYRALQPQVGREVAVKAIRRDVADRADFVRGFEREAQIVACFEHPHVVPLHDYWRDPEGAYLVMRYLRGGNLEELIADGGALTPPRAARILDDVAGALAAAHRQGIVHRDVKPSNILLDEDGNAYLSDFGIALEACGPGPATEPRASAFRSPEELRLERATARSDIYSLGVLLRAMLSGEPGNRSISPAFDAVVARATAIDPRVRFGDALELAAAFRRLLEGSAADVVVPHELRNPYKGLRSFLEPDAEDFFGREALTDELVARLEEPRADARFLCVVGPSGSGKSSLVRAGLVPALRRGAIEGSERWFVVEMLPGSHPLRELESALLSVAVDPPPSLLLELERDELGLVRAVDRVLPDPSAEVLIVIDQLEEAFTLAADPAERRRFLEILAAAATWLPSRVRVVATLRADFFDQPLSVRGFGDLLAARSLAIAPMTPDQLERAISGPARRAGFDVEPSLVAAMIADVVDRPGALPLLQYALTELAERDEASLTVEGYRRIGGASGALARRAERLYGALDDDGANACRQLFLQLVTLGEGSEDTRRRVRRSTLSPQGAAMDVVTEAFGRHRLLSFDRDANTREPTVEIAHEALLGTWSRLREWIDAARDDLRARNALARSAAEWDSAERDESFLLRGARLEQVEQWAETTDLALSDLDRTYLRASTARRDEDLAAEELRRARERALERRSVLRLRGLVAVLTAAALVASVLTAIALGQRGRAASEAATAERQRRLATARVLATRSAAEIGIDTERALLLAMRAVHATNVDGIVTPEAEEALHLALQNDRLVAAFPGQTMFGYRPDGHLLTATIEGNDARVHDTATGRDLFTVRSEGPFRTNLADGAALDVSPGGRFLVTQGDDRGWTWLWNAGSGDLAMSNTPLSSSTSDSQTGSWIGAFTRDDRYVALAHGWHGSSVLDTTSGATIASLPISIGPMAFSPDGRRLLIANLTSADAKGAAQVYDWRSPARTGELTLPGTPSSTLSVAWSPDGSRIATGSIDGSVTLWRATDLARLATFDTGISVSIVRFSHDGTRLAAGLRDGSADVYDLRSGSTEPTITLGGRNSEDATSSQVVRNLAFSPSDEELATSTAEGTSVWDVTPSGSREWLTLPGSAGLAYRADGTQLAVATSDGTIELHDAITGATERTIANGAPVDALAFDASGARIATAGTDRTMRIWNVTGGGPATELRASARDVAFDADGNVLAEVAGSFVKARTWSGSTGRVLRSFPVRQQLVTFSPDGRLLAVAYQRFAPDDSHGTVNVWDVADGKMVGQVALHGAVSSMAFDRDGSRLAIGALDGTLTVWRATTNELFFGAQAWKRIVTVPGDFERTTDLEFSPDGTLIAAATEDSVVQLIDARTGRPLSTISRTARTASGIGGSGDPVGALPSRLLAFSPDGNRLAVLQSDGTVRVLALESGDLMRLARARIAPLLTAAECDRYAAIVRCPGIPS